MPAAAIVIPLATTAGLAAFNITAAGVGATVLTAAGIQASTLVASTVGGAIIGAGTGALSAAIQGQDIAKGALTGAVGGGVGSGVSAGLGSALGIGEPAAGSVGPTLPTFSQAAAQRGLSSLAGTAAGALTGGASFDQALRSGLISGAGGVASAGAQYGLGLSPSASSAIGATTKTALDIATAPKFEAPQFKAPESPIKSKRPSASLGQSLSIAPSLGYSPGMTVFGSGGEGDKPKSKVWNVSSLRNVGESEA